MAVAVSQLVSQMQETLSSIHETISSLSGLDHEARLDELEQGCEKQLSALRAGFEQESAAITQKRQAQLADIVERRRREDEEREARRRQEDEALHAETANEDQQRQERHEHDKKEVEESTENMMDSIEEEAEKTVADGKAKLAALEAKRKELNRQIDEHLSVPLPVAPARRKTRRKAIADPEPIAADPTDTPEKRSDNGDGDRGAFSVAAVAASVEQTTLLPAANIIAMQQPTDSDRSLAEESQPHLTHVQDSVGHPVEPSHDNQEITQREHSSVPDAQSPVSRMVEIQDHDNHDLVAVPSEEPQTSSTAVVEEKHDSEPLAVSEQLETTVHVEPAEEIPAISALSGHEVSHEHSHLDGQHEDAPNPAALEPEAEEEKVSQVLAVADEAKTHESGDAHILESPQSEAVLSDREVHQAEEPKTETDEHVEASEEPLRDAELEPETSHMIKETRPTDVEASHESIEVPKEVHEDEAAYEDPTHSPETHHTEEESAPIDADHASQPPAAETIQEDIIKAQHEVQVEPVAEDSFVPTEFGHVEHHVQPEHAGDEHESLQAAHEQKEGEHSLEVKVDHGFASSSIASPGIVNGATVYGQDNLFEDDSESLTEQRAVDEVDAHTILDDMEQDQQESGTPQYEVDNPPETPTTIVGGHHPESLQASPAPAETEHMPAARELTTPEPPATATETTFKGLADSRHAAPREGEPYEEPVTPPRQTDHADSFGSAELVLRDVTNVPWHAREVEVTPGSIRSQMTVSASSVSDSPSPWASSDPSSSYGGAGRDEPHIRESWSGTPTGYAAERSQSIDEHLDYGYATVVVDDKGLARAAAADSWPAAQQASSQDGSARGGSPANLFQRMRNIFEPDGGASAASLPKSAAQPEAAASPTSPAWARTPYPATSSGRNRLVEGGFLQGLEDGGGRHEEEEDEDGVITERSALLQAAAAPGTSAYY